MSQETVSSLDLENLPEKEINRDALYHKKWRIKRKARDLGRSLTSLEQDEINRIDLLLKGLREGNDPADRSLSPLEDMIITLTDRMEYLISLIEERLPKP